MNTLSSWISGTLMAIMGLLGLLFTSRADGSVAAAMGLIMFAFSVFFIFRLIINAGRED